MVNLPRSSEQILHPEKYWLEETIDEPVVVKGQDVEELFTNDGPHVVHQNTFGEIRCAILTCPVDKRLNPADMPFPPSVWTNQGALGWGGDRFFLLAAKAMDENTSQQPEILSGIWFTMWDTPQDCEEFVAQYEIHRPSSTRGNLRLGKRCAVFFFNIEDPLHKALERRLRTSPPEFTQNGKPWSFTYEGKSGDAK